MSDLYTVDGPSPQEPTAWKPIPLKNVLQDSTGYRPDPGLVDAVNVALTLGMPLLVTGEPGVGKTALADSVARRLGLGDPLKFVAKSESRASDLFFTYDRLLRFQESHCTNEPLDFKKYISYVALGQAILNSRSREEWGGLLDGKPHDGPKRSVVLIDEIDKAPRDFVNDLLVEIERLAFPPLPDMPNQMSMEADPNLAPVVIITSNQERSLPDPFLRRCVYYHIPFPNHKQLQEIVEVRMKKLFNPQTQPAWLARAMELFWWLREGVKPELRRKPGLGELLTWLVFLGERAIGQSSLKDSFLFETACPLMLKTSLDQGRQEALIKVWTSSSKQG
ncbi:MAG: MoxR family ATPase [Nitrospirae bacterium]|nr:MoxR family ATPase [Magnetococcales bacterium]HAT49651.1 ATPase [Alphaproteobacteria bacterium]